MVVLISPDIVDTEQPTRQSLTVLELHASELVELASDLDESSNFDDVSSSESLDSSVSAAGQSPTSTPNTLMHGKVILGRSGKTPVQSN